MHVVGGDGVGANQVGVEGVTSILVRRTNNEVPVAPDCLAVPHLPVPCHYDGLRRLAVPRFYVLCGRYGSLLRPCRVLPAVQDHLSGF